MSRAEILDVLSRHRPEMERRFGIVSLALFGSSVREELRPDSDIDVLVDYPGPPSFDQYFGLKVYLEDLFQREIDLVTRKGLRPEIRPYVEKEALSVP